MQDTLIIKDIPAVPIEECESDGMLIIQMPLSTKRIAMEFPTELSVEDKEGVLQFVEFVLDYLKTRLGPVERFGRTVKVVDK